ncbi:MAG: hypothetical protein JOY51_06595 [Nevskia sp.]|nr:hypothetical protein [Nevskia sp.]
MSAAPSDLPELLEGHAAFAAKALLVARTAHLELIVRSDCLERALYGSEEFVDAVKAFLLGNERTRLLVLVGQPQQAAQNGARLVELGRRLSSRVEFREPAPGQGEIDPAEWLIADRRVLLERRSPQDLQAQFWAQEPRRGKTRGEEFDALWNEAQPAQEMRSLGI